MFNQMVPQWMNQVTEMTKKVQVDLDKQQKMSAAMLKDINNVVDQVKESNYQEKVENRVNEAGETFAKTMN